MGCVEDSAQRPVCSSLLLGVVNQRRCYVCGLAILTLSVWHEVLAWVESDEAANA